MIEIQDVVKQYTSEVQIGPITLSIPKGGLTSIIGPNGAGKSTTLLMVGRLMGMDEGQIKVAGMDVSSANSKDLAKILAILKQENHFITRLTVRQLVGFGRFPYSGGRLTQEDEAIISKYIDFLDLRDLENRYLNELSGGQRQRAYVAMVLAQETEYVLLDEPLNNLDIARSVDMLQHLSQACDAYDRTIVTVLHDINFAAQYSDQIICMKEGQVICQGTPDQVMDGPLLTSVFETDIEIIETSRGKMAIY